MLARDWIGLRVEVMESPNPCEVGLKGVVVDETMNTLRIETERGVKVVAKMHRVFAVEIDGRRYRVDGRLIAFRPEERIMKGMMLVSRIKG
ncbi:MAG: ribonuclease P protein subunit [Archaeoglobi archaeon]|nr:ribonuclease P protein subunit [Archaeoglobi archaeon]